MHKWLVAFAPPYTGFSEKSWASLSLELTPPYLHILPEVEIREQPQYFRYAITDVEQKKLILSPGLPAMLSLYVIGI